MKLKQHSVLPGFNITLGLTLLYLSIIVLIPLSTLFINTSKMSYADFISSISSARVMHAYKLSFTVSFLASLTNVFFGLIIAWVLVRYNFPGKKFIDALIDVPFALPTAVAGIALTAIYLPNGIIGKYFAPYDIKIAFTPIGIYIALIFIGLPFVVRTVQPVLQDMGKELEESAATLGATRFQTFNLIIFPHIFPSLITGFAMAFARALGEYGSVIFIAGNIPQISEIVPLIIVIKLEQYDTAGATAIALVMLCISFAILLLINYFQKWQNTKLRG